MSAVRLYLRTVNLKCFTFAHDCSGSSSHERRLQLFVSDLPLGVFIDEFVACPLAACWQALRVLIMMAAA